METSSVTNRESRKPEQPVYATEIVAFADRGSKRATSQV